jgi:hypothetical protein
MTMTMMKTLLQTRATAMIAMILSWRHTLAMGAAGVLAGVLLLSSTGIARADYGKGAVYQIEISGNCNGPTTCIPGFVQGYGVWLWAELDANGTGNYEAADCGHGYGDNAGFHDSGGVQWGSDGTTLTITGATIFGPNKVPIIITVPARYGHYAESFAQAILVPALGGALPGWAQVQVAP